MVNVGRLATSWREEANVMERRGLEVPASLLRSCAADLEERMREWQLEELTLEEAAEEARVHYDTMRKMVARGEVPNAGKKGSPRVRRCDLRRDGSPGELRDEDAALVGDALLNRQRAG